MSKVLLNGLDFPEGPAIDSQGTIWLVELKGGNLLCFTSEQEIKRYPVNGGPNGIAIDRMDNIWFCDSKNNCISRFDQQTKNIEVVCSTVEEEPLNQPNDLAFDLSGNLLFTCPGNSRQEPTGYACVLSKGIVRKITEQKFFPNGLAFTPDGKELVVAETYRHRIWKGKWDAVSCRWTEEAPWVEVGGPVGPDGMAFDSDGNLYVAVFGKQAVKVVSPEGQIIEEIPLPGKNPTNCAFLPTGGLLVTETERGELVWIENGVKGCPLFK
ncbi:SMP-30/gluconolactonase/LRE family protein [Parabacteroides sp. Marseille-P3160]|uniref:SMP-30/gluconolactonase/LRE family protein n=1 Tax=Parabacteroides sp. Marseille-P3160 TaxID=1917887 RepID=UPI0009BA0BB7|nr:SMP-30/gluconolactonase/LRE family protein [Parabacteroides sp. Marseille-P3160]